MFVRWQNSKTVSRRKRQGKVNRCRAILVENARIDGKPKQRYIAFLASYDPDPSPWNDGPKTGFWRQAKLKLDRLSNRVSPEERLKIETALAARVPRPTPEEQERGDRQAGGR